MFTVMIWMRDIFKNCPCQVLLEECGISANPRISTSGELYDVIKSTLQNYYPHWPPLGPICESTGSYLSRPGNQAFTMTLPISALSLLLHHSSLVGSIGHPILLLVLRIFARSFWKSKGFAGCFHHFCGSSWFREDDHPARHCHEPGTAASGAMSLTCCYITYIFYIHVCSYNQLEFYKYMLPKYCENCGCRSWLLTFSVT